MKPKSLLYHYTITQVSALAMPFFVLYFLLLTIGLNDAQVTKVVEYPVMLWALLAVVVLAPGACVIGFRKKGQMPLLEYINVSWLRYFVAVLMFFYGYGKMHSKFFEITYLTQDTKVGELNSFFLTWYFYGRSNMLEFMLGLMEFIPAIMLLFRRSFFWGAVLMLPVSGNVMMINLFNHLSGLTFLVSIVIFWANFLLVYSRKREIIAFFRQIAEASKFELSPRLSTVRLVFKVVVIGVVGFNFLRPIYHKLAPKPKSTYNGRNKITGGFELATLEVNHKNVPLTDTGKYYFRSIYLEPQSRWNKYISMTPGTEPTGIMVQWNPSNDSVRTTIKVVDAVESTEADPHFAFSGTYKQQGQQLLVEGIQGRDTIKAVYNKKPLKDYKWFW